MKLLILSFLIAICFLYPAIIFAESISVEGQDVSYEISSGQISSIILDPISRELDVNVSSEEDGKLTIIIPRALLDSKLENTDDVFYVLKNGLESSYEETDSSENVRTLVVSFSKGDSEIRVLGTESSIKTQGSQSMQNPNTQKPNEKNGCLIATAAYGTELAPQVQLLREIRDSKLLQTDSGSSFMAGFNVIYYSFSPSVADLERQNPLFKETIKTTITPLLTTLSILNYVDIDSEQQMVGYGIGIILLNIGIYFVIPSMLIITTKKYLKNKKISY